MTNEVFAKHIIGIHNDQRGYTCTGTLIDSNTILTAGHCFMGPASDHTVFFTKSDYFHSTKYAKIVNYKIHPGFNISVWTNRNDVAIARFEGPLPAGYASINLPTADAIHNINGGFFATGYGATTARRGVADDGAGILRYTTMKLSEQNLTETQNQFDVDQSDGHGVCFGDSGGPAFIKYGDQRYIIGIASAVYSKDEAAKQQPDYDVCRYHSLYTAVFPYEDWIHTTAAGL